jgi:hypothetical protein
MLRTPQTVCFTARLQTSSKRGAGTSIDGFAVTEKRAGFELEPEHSMGGLLRELLIGHFEMLRKILQPRAVDSSQGASVTRQSDAAIVFGSSVELAERWRFCHDSRWERAEATLMFSFMVGSPKTDIMMRFGNAIAACTKPRLRSKNASIIISCKHEVTPESNGD